MFCSADNSQHSLLEGHFYFLTVFTKYRTVLKKIKKIGWGGGGEAVISITMF